VCLTLEGKIGSKVEGEASLCDLQLRTREGQSALIRRSTSKFFSKKIGNQLQLKYMIPRCRGVEMLLMSVNNNGRRENTSKQEEKKLCGMLMLGDARGC
jgi:hypothetical protein